VLKREETPELDPMKERQLLQVLERDLLDSGEQVVVHDGFLELPDRAERCVLLSHALAPDMPGSTVGRTAHSQHSDAILIDHLVVERALPAAVQKALSGSAVDQPREPSFPWPVAETEGVPAFELEDFCHGWSEAKPRAVLCGDTLGIQDPFLVRLGGPYLERLSSADKKSLNITKDSWLIFSRIGAGPFDAHHKGLICVLRHEGEEFRASRKSVTVGELTGRAVQGRELINVRYKSAHPDCVPQSVSVEGATILGRLEGFFKDGSVFKLR